MKLLFSDVIWDTTILVNILEFVWLVRYCMVQCSSVMYGTNYRYCNV